MRKAEELKTVAQLRRAILPLVELLRVEANREIGERLDIIERSLIKVAERELQVSVKAPDVKVEVPKALTESLSKLTKLSKSEPVALPPSAYEPHDQAQDKPFSYAGFQRDDGAWYIQRVAKGEQRYAKGQGDYRDAWDRRGKLKYGDING